MMIGRRRRRPASCMASIRGTPSLRSSFDSIQFQDGVVDDDTAGHDDTDGTHQVHGMAAYPEHQQGGCHIDRNFKQHDERLQETFKLGCQE